MTDQTYLRVRVNGTTYESFRAAWRACGLPMGPHRACRRRFRANGFAFYQSSDRHYLFETV